MEDLDLNFDPPDFSEDSWDDDLEAFAAELEEPESADPLGDLIASIDAAIAAGAPELQADETPQPEVIRRGHLIFSLSGRRFAAPIDRIARLDRLGPVTPTPNTPPFVLGVANVRGAVVPALDLRRLLGLPAAERLTEGRLVQLKSHHEELVAGVVVDSLHGIRAFDAEDAGGDSPQLFDVDGLFESPEIRGLMTGAQPRSG